jgi:hypothetical protein
MQCVLAVITAQHVLDVLLAPFLTLSTFASFWSGALATTALVTRQAREELSWRVDVGLAIGFIQGLPVAALALIVGLSST